MESVGIIGFGAFGHLLAEILSSHVETVLVNDKQAIKTSIKGVTVSDFQTVASAPLVIIATDLSGIEPVCTQLKPYVSSQTIVMDICSVKEKPQEILQRVLGDACRVVATHPLFGPQSVEENGGVKGLAMAVCPNGRDPLPEIHELFKHKIGLKMLSMTAEDHDKDMAWVHGLTFFVGRTLLNMQPPKSVLTTQYYQKLLDLVELEKQHSEALFATIQQGNRYVSDIRQKFTRQTQKIASELTKNHNCDTIKG